MANQLLSSFQVEKDVKNLRNCMKGVGTDEETLVEILGNRTPQQMVQIINTYKKTYEKTLSSEIENEVSGIFGEFCVGLADPILEFDLICIHEAMNGWFGSNDSVLIEVLIGRTEKDMGIIKTAYIAKYGKEIEDDVRENLSGDFRTLFLSVLSKKDLNQNDFNPDEDVETLYKSGDGKKWGHNKEPFIKILTTRNYKQLNEIFYRYEKKYNKSFLSAIRNNFSGDLENALVNIAKSAMNRVQLIAELFENALSGIGTKHSKLIRLIVRHRSPAVMDLIKKAYQNLYGRSLKERIENEVLIDGLYEKLIMKCIGEEEE